MSNIDRIKSKIKGMPVLGPFAQTVWLAFTLPRQIKSIKEEQLHAIDLINKEIIRQSQNFDDSVRQISYNFTEKYVSIDEQIDDVKHRLQSIKVKPKPIDSNPDSSANNKELFADNHDLDDFYVKFENKFRGTEEEIKDRLRIYIPYFKDLKTDFKKKPVLDIGCGRGELLGLLKEHGIRAVGLDINETMVGQCIERGFEAIQADALEYLMKQKTGSVSAITGFHIVEHIPFSFLLRLFEECHRVLIPGGIIIFETPNPENLHVGSFSFYYDPSHLHPLPPEVLAFAIQNRGFEKADILRLHPSGDGHENDGRDDPALQEIVRRFYMEQDYSVIGHKAG